MEQFSAIGKPISMEQLLAYVQLELSEGRHEVAHAVLSRTAIGLQQAGMPEDHIVLQDLRLRSWRCAPFWWQPQGDANGYLRRTQREDALFFEACFQNAEFARRYNRQPPWTGNLENALHKAGTQSPAELGQLHWLGCGESGEPRGLLSLSNLDFVNRKAEFSIGMAGSAIPMLATRLTCWALQFAFFTLGLNRLYAYIYTDNPEARDNCEHLGFRMEGCLKDHFYLPPGNFHDLWVLGLTRAQVLEDPRLLRLAKRFTGADWQRLAAENPFRTRTM